MQITSGKPKIFSETGLQNLVGFSATLQRIHNRLIAEGYKIENGRIIAPEKKSAIIAKTQNAYGHSRQMQK